ncbi:MAG: sigma-70 family RNA polymerase sigma factor [Clostridia bacterium]|nr:sigma-70 family RNA polymerase sigma factor [Clostridia bacterium]
MADKSVVLSDEKLVSLVKSGNNECFDVLHERYGKLIESFAEKYSAVCIKSDLVDAGISALSDAIISYREDAGASFKTFAKTCIESNMLDVCKKANNSKRIPKDLVEPLDGVDLPDSNDPESLLIKKEYFDLLLGSIKSKLSDLEYSVIYKTALGMSYKEIAAQIGKGEKSVENALLRARQKIKELKR